MPATARKCEFPTKTALDSAFVDRAYYKDSYSIQLKDASSSPARLFHAVFGYRPVWMKVVMLGRNGLARLFGLSVSSKSEIMKPILAEEHTVGGKIGGWPIYALTRRELVAGRDNKHLDFRLSVLAQEKDDKACVVISTICTVHKHIRRTLSVIDYSVPQIWYPLAHYGCISGRPDMNSNLLRCPRELTHNPSRKRSASGRTSGPSWRHAVHFRQPGPGVLPSSLA